MVLRSATQARTRPHRLPMKELDSPSTPVAEIGLGDSDDEPPTKRLRTSRSTTQTQRTRWIPGGRGGGGMRIPLGEEDVITPREPRERRSRSERKRDTSSRRPVPRTSTRTSRTNRRPGQPRYSTAAAAAAARPHDDYKPREERGWEEYHPDLDLDSAFAMIPSEYVDGIVAPDAEEEAIEDGEDEDISPLKKRPGLQQRSRSTMLQSLLTPEAPKFVPPPGPNPRERLTLPKPSYRILDPFEQFDGKDYQADNFVDVKMASVGYQESEIFIRPTYMIRQMEGSADEDLDLMPDLVHSEGNSAIGGNGVGRVEYDMDEQDVKWLDALNKIRLDEGVQPIKPSIFEVTMTKVEKEWHALEKRIPKPNPKAPQTQRPRSSSAAAVNGEPGPDAEPDSKCAICDDGDCENANAIVFCDGCDLAVHQECYGVPYIPEGQWLCRKCQLVGNARPSCIFCPNEGGAFKQTNNTKWAHLLCATWIPEVTIGNPSLMEPITDVEKVPNSRWKLGCYICKQSMGASIQCADSRCYEPFHLTCARQAGLYLKMKIGGGQNTLMDPGQLRAFCHKHSPTDWKHEHRTERKFEKAVKYFKHHFAGQIWADSKSSALAMTDTSSNFQPEQGPRLTLTNKKGAGGKAKSIWKLPSGAPVIPEVILKTIEEALYKFGVVKRKEYVAEICKYWTLKREARRGAALLKRLQLQMETFSSFEVTRRDYKAMGAAGRTRLERRIEFAEVLVRDLERIRTICERVMKREEQKLEESKLLAEVVDTIYFPIGPLLLPIITKSLNLDKEGVYMEALNLLQEQIENRHYSAVSTFSKDFAKIFEDDVGFDASDMSNEQALKQRPTTQLDDPAQRERRTLARRIVKAAYPLLSTALRKESELLGRPFEQQMKEMDALLFSRRASIIDDNAPHTEADTPAEDADTIMVDVSSKDDSHDTPMASIENDNDNTFDSDTIELNRSDTITVNVTATQPKTNGVAAHTPPASTNGHFKAEAAESRPILNVTETTAKAIQPPTPPISTKGQSNNPLVHGGIPWYVEAFDPKGTSVYEERWLGKDVLRDLSEELSDMDEGDLQDLAGEDETVVVNGAGVGKIVTKGLGKGWRKGMTGNRKRKSVGTTTRKRR